jgi:SecD/SecF fusion protein
VQQVNVRNRFILIAVVTALLVWAYVGRGLSAGFDEAIPLGQDLRGGTTLRFSLDIDRAVGTGRIPGDKRAEVVDQTIAVIRDRIDKFGLTETTITPLGEDKFEISLPAGTEPEGIVDVVTALGDLQFRIEVLPRESYGFDEGTPPRLQAPRQEWPWSGTTEEFQKFKEEEVERWKRARETATPYEPSDERYFVVRRRDAPGANTEDFVVLENPPVKEHRFSGEILEDPQPGFDDMSGHVVHFEVKTDYQNVFGEWTDRNVGLPMAIVLNEEYYSAPRINEKLTTNVQITLGTRNAEEALKESKELATVLQTGALQVRPDLESRNRVGAKLAGESRDRGVLATIIAFVLVLVFMVVYYRWSGLVANVALLLNLVLLLGILAYFGATLTLPGIAGIVLTIGMAVDANILINERMHEERRAGRPMQKAVAEGYDRALSTIVDANLTSLITAIFLYAYGSGPIRGFAVTLAIGLVVSMFTAIYVTRTIFEWALKRGTLKEIRMLGTGIPPRIRWMAMRRYFAPISALGVVFGLVVFAVEDPIKLYDIDFTGGYKLQVRLVEPMSVDGVKNALGGAPREVTVFREVEGEQGNLVQEPRRVTVGPYREAEVLAVGTGGRAFEISVQRMPSEAEISIDEQGQAFQEYVEAELGERLQPSWMPEAPRAVRAAGEDTDDAAGEGDGESGAPDESPDDGTDESADEEETPATSGLAMDLTLIDPAKVVTPELLEDAIAKAMPYYTYEGGRRIRNSAELVKREVDASVKGEDGDLRTFAMTIRTEDDAGRVVENDPQRLRTQLADFFGGREFQQALETRGVAPEAAEQVERSDPFPSLDLIGSSVANRLKNDALIALFFSLLGIILYIAVRFSSRAMGLSAVLCLFHDVAFTLGIVAVANLLGLVDAKINLAIVAAFLTLVGYSVNDTVVVFDRIRENRGKRTTITEGMLDDSVNQTFIRSIKTSVTFFVVALVLFVLNIGQRNVLEGFAFVLAVGSIIGSFSTIAIAAPLLMFLPWYWERIRRFAPPGAIVSRPASTWWLLPLVPLAALVFAAWWVAFGALAFLVGLVVFTVWAVRAEPPRPVTAPA